VIYAVREYAATVVDVIARRTRLAFLNVRAAEESLPRVIELMSRELGWSKQREQEEYAHAMRFLSLEMGLNLKDDRKSVPINFTKDEINLYMKRFRALDTDSKGFITIADLRSYFMVHSLNLNSFSVIARSNHLRGFHPKTSERHSPV